MVVPRPPSAGIWGSAKYPELCDPIIEIARRLSRNSRLLDLYSGPVPVFKASEPDAATRYGVADTDTDDESREKILKGQIGQFEQETVFLPDDLVGVSFLQPQIQGVSTALQQVAEMKEAISSLTGLPSLTGGASVPSGEALKRVFLHFYAESSALQTTLTDAFSSLLGVEVTWEHVFDQMEMQAFMKAQQTASIAVESGPDEPAQ